MMLTAYGLQESTSENDQLDAPQRDVDQSSKVTACYCIRTLIRILIRILAIPNVWITIIDPTARLYEEYV